MSTPPAPALEPELKESAATTIPPVTDSYQKAHKSYVLFSALLASWQIIGITLETKEKWGITLKSPNAIPLVLVALVVYFGYKVTIEWKQCDEQRRLNVAAAVDFRVAHTLAILALVITSVQYLLRIQIFDVLSRQLNRYTFLIGLPTIVLAWKLTNLAAKAYRFRLAKKSKVIKEYKLNFQGMTQYAMINWAGLLVFIILIICFSRQRFLVSLTTVLVGAMLGSFFPLLGLIVSVRTLRYMVRLRETQNKS
jgi:hypothetical protein